MLGGLLASATPGLPEFSECRIGPEGAIGLKAECLEVSLPEDHAAPDGRQITVKVARLPARSRAPAAAPLVFIAGGPGQSAIETFAGARGAFSAVRQQRDILLIDQRGTGESSPLRCEALEEAEATLPQDEGMLAAWTRDCLASLEGDPRWYSTVDAVRDLEVLRERLGYPAYVLYGISYGTRVAQEYLRQYPERVERVVLDGVVPPDAILGTEIANDAQRALENVFRRCEQQESCAARFPALRDSVARIKELLGEDGRRVSVRDAYSGEMEDVTMSWPRVAMVVRMFSYAPETLSLLPLLLDDAVNERWDAIAAASSNQASEIGESINIGMHNAVVCTEDFPFFPVESAGTSDAYLGDEFLASLRTMCGEWPGRELPASFKSLVASDKPVLLLSGELDPVTPPHNAEQAMALLTNARHLVAEGQGHGVAMRGCMPRILADFYEGTGPADLDVECLEDFQADPFFLNRNAADLGGHDDQG